MAQPYIRFFGSDWRSDPSLRLCSLAARGLWIDMISLMMESKCFGFLLVNDQIPSVEQIASLINSSPREVRKAIAELEQNGVFSRSEDGAIFSRRLVKDHEKQIQAKEYGTRGGNPTLKGKQNRRVNPPATLPLTQGLTVPLTPPLNPHGNYHSHSHNQILPVVPPNSDQERESAILRIAAAAHVEPDLWRSSISGWLDVWITRGAALVDCIAAVQRGASRKPATWSPTALTYFDRIVDEELSRRTANPTASDPPPALDEATRTRSLWRARCKGYLRLGPTSWIDDKWGPAPGQPDCQVPAEILAEFDLLQTPDQGAP